MRHVVNYLLKLVIGKMLQCVSGHENITPVNSWFALPKMVGQDLLLVFEFAQSLDGYVLDDVKVQPTSLWKMLKHLKGQRTVKPTKLHNFDLIAAEVGCDFSKSANDKRGIGVVLVRIICCPYFVNSFQILEGQKVIIAAVHIEISLNASTRNGINIYLGQVSLLSFR